MKTRKKSLLKFVLLIALIAGTSLGATPCVLADEGHMCLDWRKLQLSPEQSQQIQILETQWTKEYTSVQPAIIEDQHRLAQLLADSKSDPLEIMSLQQSIARKREQLRSVATANFLHKRQLLTPDQQKNLEDMIQRRIAERQKLINPGVQSDVMTDHIQGLMQRVRDSFSH